MIGCGGPETVVGTVVITRAVNALGSAANRSAPIRAQVGARMRRGLQPVVQSHSPAPSCGAESEHRGEVNRRSAAPDSCSGRSYLRECSDRPTVHLTNVQVGGLERQPSALSH